MFRRFFRACFTFLGALIGYECFALCRYLVTQTDFAGGNAAITKAEETWFAAFFVIIFGVIYLEFLGTLCMKLIFRRKKELYDIETDKIIYNLVFKDSSVDIISTELVMNISYTRIIKILKVEEGYFLHYNENNFVFCSTKQLDTQTNKELLKLLQSIPDVKWEEAKQWTLI